MKNDYYEQENIEKKNSIFMKMYFKGKTCAIYFA